MGLDTVELIINIEKHFKILIHDAEVEEITTIRELAECVKGKVLLSSDANCKSQVLFYILRDYVADELQYTRERFLPSTHIDDVFPKANREAIWIKMINDMDLELPLSSIGEENRLWKNVKLAVNIKSEEKQYTIRDFIRWLLVLNHHRLVQIDNLFSVYDFEVIIMGILYKVNGIELHEMDSSSRFAYDLGLE